jgi:peptide/nickel transport system ATP-binding protein
VTIQAQLLRLMKSQVQARSASLILITHDLAAVSQMADRILVLYCGRVVEIGSAAELIARPRHPYTRGLLDSIPGHQASAKRLRQIPGAVPDIRRLPLGCAFAPRCLGAREICRSAAPELDAIPGAAPGHAVACHFPLEAA